MVELKKSRRKDKKAVPIFLFLLTGYLDYSICYLVGYKAVYKFHTKAGAIVLWVLFGAFQLSFYIYWLLIFIRGPGKRIHINPFNIYSTTDEKDLTPVPDIFPCDENGYPFWCSTCQSIKPPRSLHSSDLNYCVPKLDHYCIWIGTVLGQFNYEFFFKFLQCFNSLMIISLVFLAYCTGPHFEKGTAEVKVNYVGSYVICGFGFIMASLLYFVHIKYVFFNITTVDDLRGNQLSRYERWKKQYHSEKAKGKDTTHIKSQMPRRETGKLYANMKHGDSRAVVEYYINEKPYSFGFRKNLIHLIYNNNLNTGPFTEFVSSYSSLNFYKALVILLIPYLDMKLIRGCRNGQSEPTVIFDENCCDRISDDFIEVLESRIKEGKYTNPQYLVPETRPSLYSEQAHSARGKEEPSPSTFNEEEAFIGENTSPYQ